MAFEAGRIMLERVDNLLKYNGNFAIETTLSTKSYKQKLFLAKQNGFTIKLLFFWLPTIEMAINRVAIRVSEGGHTIPKDVIERRYKRGIENLFKIYLPLCDDWAVFDNSDKITELIAAGNYSKMSIKKQESWNFLKSNCI